MVDSDDREVAAKVLAPIRSLGPVLNDDVALMPYPDTLEDGGAAPAGLRFLMRSAFVYQESVPQALQILADVASCQASLVIAVRSVGGAVARVPDLATAYAHRRAELMILMFVAGTEPVVDSAEPGLDAIWERLGPHVNGAYANFLSTATGADVAAVYPTETYRRLAAIKRRYDAANLFSRNHNVRPSSSRLAGGRSTEIRRAG
jgi:hypothetical protein